MDNQPASISPQGLYRPIGGALGPITINVRHEPPFAVDRNPAAMIRKA
jgi:hypothetical protein